MSAAPALRVTALLASHNRREQTLRCLAALRASAEHAGVALNAVLVDDGSRDGTAAAVRAESAWVTVIEADGSLYWCRSMHRAFSAVSLQQVDHLLWLNDDTLLRPEALSTLLRCMPPAESAAPCIVAGSCSDSATQRLSYGGRVRVSRWRRTRWQLVMPSAEAQRIHTFDGNVVLINRAAAQRVGNLDAGFEHAMGDFDYGLRAQRLGVPLWLAPGVLAHCSPNPRRGGFNDSRLPLRQRWQQLLAPKGLPWRSWLLFTRRHAGPAWWLYFAWPYVRVAIGRSAQPQD